LDAQNDRIQGVAAVEQLARSRRIVAATSKEGLEKAGYAAENAAYHRTHWTEA
jgi:hypothetical protein